MSVRTQRTYPYRGKSPQNAPFVAHFPLDLFSLGSELCVPRDDEVLNDLLLKHYTSLTPSSEDQQSLSSFVARVSEIFDSLIVNPTDFTAGQIAQARCIGSFKSGTWLSGQAAADIVVVLRTLPTLQAIESLMEIVRQRLTSQITAELSLQPYGFRISSGSGLIQVMVTTVPVNLKKLNSDVHIDVGLQKTAMAAVRQARWLEENASYVVINGFRHLSDWMICLLAHHAVLVNPLHQSLPVNVAFRRLLQLLAAGLLLPGSAGIIDPCEMGIVRPHSLLSLAAQDELCCAAQTLLRILLHGSASLLFTYNEADNSGSYTRERMMEEASLASDGLLLVWSKPVIEGVEGGGRGPGDGEPEAAAAAPVDDDDDVVTRSETDN